MFQRGFQDFRTTGFCRGVTGCLELEGGEGGGAGRKQILANPGSFLYCCLDITGFSILSPVDWVFAFKNSISGFFFFTKCHLYETYANQLARVMVIFQLKGDLRLPLSGTSFETPSQNGQALQTICDKLCGQS